MGNLFITNRSLNSLHISIPGNGRDVNGNGDIFEAKIDKPTLVSITFGPGNQNTFYLLNSLSQPIAKWYKNRGEWSFDISPGIYYIVNQDEILAQAIFASLGAGALAAVLALVPLGAPFAPAVTVATVDAIIKEQERIAKL